MKTISDRIQCYMKKNGHTQESIGLALGKAQRTVSDMLKYEDDNYKVGDLNKLAEILDVPVTALIFPPEDLALISSPDPVIAPIVSEVTRIAAIPDREKADMKNPSD